MDKKETSAGVSLTSATHTEPQTILEKHNLIAISKVAKESGDKKIVDSEEESESESDNEEIGATAAGAVKNDDVNLDDEFEKIVPFKFKKLSEESLDEVDHEIEEILHEAEPLGKEIKTDTDPHNAEPSPSPVEENQKFEPVSSREESCSTPTEEKPDKSPTAAAAEQKVSIVEQKTAPPSDSNESKHIEASINKAEPKATLIAAEPVPIENCENSVDERPPVPAPTYLWEDLKRAKEHGGYPWTHLTKEPLGPDDEPQSILSYKQSPRASRKASNESHGTPKSQKKVRIQDEIEVQETQNYIQDLSDDEDATEVGTNEDDLDSDEAEEIKPDDVAQESKSPKGILKRSQQILENIKPNTSKFDSGSLKKKIKNPLQKIKKMADQQFKKVKSSRPFFKKIPVAKDEIVLNEDLKILELKESPKSQHRDIAAYIVKHQDSEDSVEIVELENSPNETRKRREAESHVLTPDEVIELPSPEKSEKSDESDQRESTVESHEISMSGSSSHSGKEETPVAPIKRDHHYEDIDDYISRITSDNEDVERATFENDPKLARQNQVSINDPIFDEFSREMNKKIRRSLSIQDDKMRHELAKRIPRIEELEKQMSDEDREEKVVEPSKINQALLAPISSIDSTSSDEDRRAQLSIVGEESETSDSFKKKSFEESIDPDIENLKNDGSDISTTLMEDQVRIFGPKVDEAPTDSHLTSEEIINQVIDGFHEPKLNPEEHNAVEVLLETETQNDVDEAPTESHLTAKEIINQIIDGFHEPEMKDEPEVLKVPVKTETQNDVESEVKEAAQEAIATAFKEALEKVANDSTKDDSVKEDVIVKLKSKTSAPVKVSERWSKMRNAFRLLKKHSKIRKFIRQCIPFGR